MIYLALALQGVALSLAWFGSPLMCLGAGMFSVLALASARAAGTARRP